MKIGITSKTYNSFRNINGITENDYIEINFLNLNAYFRALFQILNKVIRIDLSNYFSVEGYNGSLLDRSFYDIAHFFNSFSLSKKPWVSTFETKLPYIRKHISLESRRSRKIVKKALKACASDSCKAIIAMSKCSMDIELKLLSNFPEYADHIKKKLSYIYPPQKLLVKKFDEKQIDLSGKLKFIFVGREFFRKGGYDILRCFEQLSGNYDFELIVVSSLKEKKSQFLSNEKKQEVKRIIKEYNGSWLTYYSELDNESLLSLMKGCHVGLLPTYSDTFGYSVLEFQACGCPVITTDVRALPEINNDDAGWVINTGDKKKTGEIYDLEKVADNRVIEHALQKIVIEIIENPLVIKRKAEKSIERIKKYHCPVAYRRKIESIYRSGLF
jgi:glycosyltransferase involved in cell wall biosynthesis